MTYLEKYQKEHPGQMPAIPTSVGKVKKFICPSQFGYEIGDYACDSMPSCAACWMREVKEESKCS